MSKQTEDMAEASASGGVFVSKATQLLTIDQFWCVEDGYARGAVALLESIDIAECAARQQEFEARQAAESGGADKKPYEMAGSTAIVRISGPMTKRTTSASSLVGGTGTKATRVALHAANADSSVDRVLLHIDSPGGQVEGTAELGDTVREFKKPIIAYIEDHGASAAYWVASQANAIYANRTGQIGSIGVVSVLIDASDAAKKSGVKVIPVTTGKYKASGASGVKVTEDDIAYLQARVDGYFDEFKAAVQTGRAMDDAAFEKVADARVVMADEALELGLIDGICSLEDCLSMIAGASASTIFGGSVKAQAASSPPSPAQQEDHDPATAQTRTATIQEPNMNPKEFVSRVRTIDPQALQKAGITDDAMNAMESLEIPATAAAEPAPVLDPKIAAQLEGLQKQADADNARFAAIALKTAHTQAVAFADAQIGKKADPEERDTIIAMYEAALVADGGGTPVFAEDGSIKTGASCKAITEHFEKRSPVIAKMRTVANSAGNTTLDADKPGENQISEERRKELLAMTPNGAAILAKEAK